MLLAAATAIPVTPDKPFMCISPSTSLHARAVDNAHMMQALQVDANAGAGCKEGDDECDPKLTVRGDRDTDLPFVCKHPPCAETSLSAIMEDMKFVNWTLPNTYETATCDECAHTLRQINEFCAMMVAGGRRNIAAKSLNGIERLPTDPTTEFTNMLLQSGYPKSSLDGAMGVYKAVSTTYCPMDPCTQMFENSVRPDTICKGSLVNCNRHDADFQPQSPPEQAIYRGHGVNFNFGSSIPLGVMIPPKACTDYVTLLQDKCLSVDASVQYTACDGLYGLQRGGCDHIIREVLLKNKRLDFCPPLFEPPAPTPDPRLPAMDPAPIAPTRLVATDVCTSLSLPWNSPVPTELWMHLSRPTPTSTSTPSATPAPTPTETAPCVNAPTPTPIPHAIHQLFPGAVGMDTLVHRRPAIPFGCSATTSWTTVRPKIGCSFTDFNQKTAGFGDAGAAHRCTCQNEKGLISWSDVDTAEHCAQMTCNRKHRFTTCAFDEQVVSEGGQWNGDTLRFTSLALQDTCKGATASVDDVCGAVIDIKTTSMIPSLLSWKLTTPGDTTVAAAGGAASFGSDLSDLAVLRVWLPCGQYKLTLTDPSYTGGGWDGTTLSFTDSLGVGLLKLSPPAWMAHTSSATFTLDQELISTARKGLCKSCGKGANKACASVDSNGDVVCMDFVAGTELCPQRTQKCSTKE